MKKITSMSMITRTHMITPIPTHIPTHIRTYIPRHITI